MRFICAILLICWFWAASDAQSCSSKKEAECKCNDKIETGSDVRMIMQKKTEFAQTCLKQNPSMYQGCYNKTIAMMTCHTKMITQLENDPVFKQAKAEAMQELDRCFQSNPVNAFESLMMMMKKGPGGPGGKGPGGPGGKGHGGPPPPMMDDGPMMGRGPMPEPMGMFDGPPGPKKSDPSECLQMVIKGLFGGPQGPPPPMDFNGPPQMRFGGMEMRPGPGPRERCRDFEMCMMTAKKQAGSDPTLLSAARRIFDQKTKCMTDNVPTFDCIPASRERHECMESAMKSLEFYKMMKMKSCMKEAGAPMQEQW